MWTTRIHEALACDAGPHLLLGGEAYGVPYLIEDLGRDAKLAWMRATPADRDDAVAQGNLLAEAVNRAVGGQLLAGALPFAYQLRVLRHHLVDLAPLTLVLSEAQHAATLARALAEAHRPGLCVLLDAPERIPDLHVHEIPPEMLALRWEEARALAPHGLSDAAVEQSWRTSGGRMADFLVRVLRAARMPVPTLPTPDARVLPPQEARSEDPGRVVRALVRERRFVEALELAVMAQPDEVEGLLREAGPAYQERGLLGRLHLLLSSLDAPHRTEERVLEWRLVAGFAADDLDVIPEVDRHLVAFDAPRLRARRAGLLPPERAREVAGEALRGLRDPLTLFQAGRFAEDEAEAAELLLASVRVAEDEGTAYDVVRNAGMLGERYLHDGRLDEAATWLGWALDTYARKGIKDGSRRLRILNDLAVARLLLGESAGLRMQLEEAQRSLEGILPSLALLFRTTLADMARAAGREDEAHELLLSVQEGAPRRLRAHFALPWVLHCLRRGELPAAQQAAREVEALSRVDGGTMRAPARIAMAVVASVSAPDDPDTRSELLAAIDAPHLQLEQAVIGGCAALAADAALDDLPVRVGRVLRRVPDAMLEAFCTGSRAARVVRSAVRGERAPLVLALAADGPPRARLDGEPLELSGRLFEVALMLALHPEGLGDERLHDLLVGDGGAFGLSALRTHVSRLRTRVPVSRAPYRFEVPVETDVGEARALLARRRVREAMALAPGPVLPGSDAPGVEAVREEFAEELRQAALASGDGEVLVELGERMPHDLEIWEAALGALADGDARVPLIKARIARLQRAYDLPDAPWANAHA